MLDEFDDISVGERFKILRNKIVETSRKGDLDIWWRENISRKISKNKKSISTEGTTILLGTRNEWRGSKVVSCYSGYVLLVWWIGG